MARSPPPAEGAPWETDHRRVPARLLSTHQAAFSDRFTMMAREVLLPEGQDLTPPRRWMKLEAHSRVPTQAIRRPWAGYRVLQRRARFSATALEPLQAAWPIPYRATMALFSTRLWQLFVVKPPLPALALVRSPQRDWAGWYGTPTPATCC